LSPEIVHVIRGSLKKMPATEAGQTTLEEKSAMARRAISVGIF